MEIRLKQISASIADKELGREILSLIETALKEHDLITIDFEGVTVMTTFCGKQIFGRLYIGLGADEFFRRIKFVNVRDELRIIIEQGILNALETT